MVSFVFILNFIKIVIPCSGELLYEPLSTIILCVCEQ